MAPEATKSPEGAAFLADVRRLVHANKHRDLARLLDWDQSDEEGKIGAWTRGERAPNFRATVALLNLAGMLRDTPETRDLLARLGLPGAVRATPDDARAAKARAAQALADLRQSPSRRSRETP